MSLLPGRILPQSEPLGTVNEDGTVIIEQNWWLLFYNLCAQVLGTTANAIPVDALIDLESVDIDVVGSDITALRRPLDNALVPSDVMIGLADLPDLQRALLLAQDPLLPDPAPRAPPAQSVTVGASPFSYTAAFDGIVAVTGGTVSAISLIRQGTSVATGITTGLFPLSRLDTLQVTYSGLPTMTFLPK